MINTGFLIKLRILILKFFFISYLNQFGSRKKGEKVPKFAVKKMGVLANEEDDLSLKHRDVCEAVLHQSL